MIKSNRAVHHGVLLGSLVWSVTGFQGVAADANSLEAFKATFASVPPRTLALEFTEESSNSRPTPQAPANNGRVVRVAPIPIMYYEFVRDGDSYAAVASSVPFHSRYAESNTLNAVGFRYHNGTNDAWETAVEANSSHPQILHYPERIPAFVAEPEKEMITSLQGLQGVLRVWNLGVDISPGSAKWTDDSFTGLEQVYGGRQPRNLSGTLKASSDGRPNEVSYRFGPRIAMLVRYQYAQQFELGFPSTIRVERYLQALETSNQPASMGSSNQPSATITYRINSLRTVLTAEDKSKLDPAYYLQSFRDATFIASDLLSLSNILRRFKEDAPANPAVQYVINHLSNDTKQLIADYDGNPDAARVVSDALVQEFSRIANGESIYDTDRFAKVQLSEETRKLLKEAQTGPHSTALNRDLLIDTFPKGLVKSARADEFIMQGDQSLEYLPHASP